ncbi:PEP-CTERM sorting domain-containing protein [Sphingobium aromaticiconvertens]|uniref:PEP-CTERM sorting domain-containing protein n=1 Tax=Sphingobium aromaticiconvertens TaxID=365341 RepID=UPI0030185C87
MNVNKLFLAMGAATLIGAATPAQATWCWFGKCGGSSSGGTSTGGSTSSSGGGSTGGATPVPEPEQMGLFAMGIAVIGVRMFRARAKRK